MTPRTPEPATPDDARACVHLRFVGHATVLLEVGGVRIVTDPFLRATLGPLRRHGPLPDPDELGAVDLVLVSHGHPDHFDPRSLASVRGRPTVVVPRGLGDQARRVVRGEVVELLAGQSIRSSGLTATATPARHWISPGSARAEPIGYVVDASGFRLYFAGDTGRFGALGRLAGTLDLALLPIWTWGPHLGPGHLGPRSAAEVAAMLGPRVVVPIHWATLYPRGLDRVWRRPLAEPGERFIERLASLAPAVDARVLRPGEATSVRMRPS